MLVLANKHGGSVYIGNKNAEQCAEFGICLYGSTRAHRKYMNDFKAYVDEARSSIIPKYKKERVPAEKELEKDFAFIEKLWEFYGKTESFYVDAAYELARRNHDDAMRERLEETSRFKFIARELMNAYFFRNGVMEHLSRSVERMFSYPHADVLHMHEMLALFRCLRIPERVAQKRYEWHAIASLDNTLIIFDADSSRQLYDSFSSMVGADDVRGICANSGRASGRAFVIPMLRDRADVLAAERVMREGDILLTETTSPELLPLCRKASAIVTSVGGLLSHAAIVSRELRIPCIVGAERVTELVRTGDAVELDAGAGVLWIQKRAQ